MIQYARAVATLAFVVTLWTLALLLVASCAYHPNPTGVRPGCTGRPTGPVAGPCK